MRFLLVCFVLLNAVDLGTTLALPLGPNGEGERNPIAARIYADLGPYGLVAYKGGIVTALCGVFVLLSEHSKRAAVRLLCFGCGVYTAVSVLNVLILVQTLRY